MRSIWTRFICFATNLRQLLNHSFLVCAGVARYKVFCKEIVAREYEAIASESDRRRILWTIGGLTDNPRPLDARKLPEHENHLRIYVKHYRVIYGVDDNRRQVTVFRIAHRRRQNPAR
jgi:mRNA-degrading endonuclease RelE of RelBE toxin-antitoxin system